MRRLRILKLLVQFLNMSMSNMSQTILIILFELYPYQFLFDTSITIGGV